MKREMYGQLTGINKHKRDSYSEKGGDGGIKAFDNDILGFVNFLSLVQKKIKDKKQNI